MTQSIGLTRRGFTLAAASTLLPGFLTLFSAPPAQAKTPSIANIWAYLLSDPFAGIVALIEEGVSLVNENTKLNLIIAGISEITDTQELILQKLADQGIVMREEITRGFLENVVADMAAAVYDFKITLGSDAETRAQMLQPSILDIDDLTFKIGSYGLAAVPAYLAAIALQNSIHYVVASSADVFRKVNEPHRDVLNEMLNGSSPNSLASFVQEARDETAILDQPKTYPLAEIVKQRRANGDIYGALLFEVMVYQVQYQGIRNGQPLLTSSTVPQHTYVNTETPSRYVHVLSSSGIYPRANAYLAKDYRDIPQLGGDVDYWLPEFMNTITFDRDDNPVFHEMVNPILESQTAAIYNYYMRILKLRQTPQGSADHMRQFIQNGLNGIDRIMAATHRMGARPAQVSSPSQPPEPRL